MIVCIEGLTNSGKSSICEKILRNTNYELANSLLKEDVVAQGIKKLTGPIENIGKYDKDVELLLYSTLLSSKANAVMKLQGNVLLDRFTLSVYSYFTGRYSMDEDIVKRIVDFSSRGIVPDITFFLDVSLDTIIERKTNSPFSRKDIGIEYYYNNLREKAIKEIDAFSHNSYVVSCDNKTVDEIYSYISSIMAWRDNE